eukprot:GCRY01005354.1.p1 GENE.GCRY01005354.1~~GCRY01005354.1.p1  ORF type:complete len:402 (-),score=88.30 GCRY01005354.1:26-1231(-)
MAAFLLVLSNVVGWGYFACWAFSTIPQIVLNHRRKKVTGLSFDYVVLNLLGFVCYSMYNIALYSSPQVKEDYERLHHSTHTPVRLNDLVFSLWAAMAMVITLLQIFAYERGSQTFSSYTFFVVGLCLGAVSFFAVLTAFKDVSILFLIHLLGLFKLGITVMKYSPQAVLNYQRKSTVGFSVTYVSLDFSGAFLSFLQMIIDAARLHDGSQLYGNATKLGLAIITIVFDIIFLVQHFVLYKWRWPGTAGTFLISSEDDLDRLLQNTSTPVGTRPPPPAGVGAGGKEMNGGTKDYWKLADHIQQELHNPQPYQPAKQGCHTNSVEPPQTKAHEGGKGESGEIRPQSTEPLVVTRKGGKNLGGERPHGSKSTTQHNETVHKHSYGAVPVQNLVNAVFEGESAVE